MAHLVEKKYKAKDGTIRRTHYQLEFYDYRRRPQRKRISLGTSDKVAARHKATELERQYALGIFDPWKAGKPDITFAAAVAKFVKWQTDLGRAPKTVGYYESLLNRFKDTLHPGAELRDVLPAHVERFLDSCDLNATSTRTYVRHLRAFFNWAHRNGHIRDVPLSGELRERMNGQAADPLPSFYTLEQFQQLCEAADARAETAYYTRYANPYWVADFIRGLFYLGARPKELAALEWRDVDTKTGYVRLRKTKNKAPRQVYVPSPMLEHFEVMAARRTSSDPDERVFKSAHGLALSTQIRKNLSRRVKALAGKLKLPTDIKALYGMRHGFATHHAMNGTPLPVVSGMLGHKRLEQVNAYAHFQPTAGQRWQESAFGTYIDLKQENERLRRELEKLKAERTNNVPNG